MTVTMDKFGRVLFPKKLRQKMNASDGSQFEVIHDEGNDKVLLKLIRANNPVIKINPLGVPIIQFPTNQIFSYDFVASIREGYEERDAKISGKL